MPTIKISELEELTTQPADDDALVVVDASTNETKKISSADFFQSPTIPDLTVTTAATFLGATIANGGTVTTTDINGGTIDGTIIGGSSSAAGTFTDLTATGTTTLTDATLTTADINAGTIDNAIIGGATAAAGTFTDLTATTITFNGTAVTSSAAELNILDGATVTTADVNQLNNVFIETTDAGGGSGTGRIGIGNTDVSLGGNGVVALGDQALSGISTSSAWGNIGIGYKAGQGITTGDSNICIGHEAASVYTSGGGTPAPEIRTGYNNIIIGFTAFPSANDVDDEITLGNAFHTNLRCNDTSISSLSDARDKTDIVDSTYGVEWLKGVKVRKYKWQSREGNGKDGLTRLGFIAQELQEACGDCNAILDIVQESNPDKLEVKMGNLVPVLTKAIQELTARIEDLEAQING